MAGKTTMKSNAVEPLIAALLILPLALIVVVAT